MISGPLAGLTEEARPLQRVGDGPPSQCGEPVPRRASLCPHGPVSSETGLSWLSLPSGAMAWLRAHSRNPTNLCGLTARANESPRHSRDCSLPPWVQWALFLGAFRVASQSTEPTEGTARRPLARGAALGSKNMPGAGEGLSQNSEASGLASQRAGEPGEGASWGSSSPPRVSRPTEEARWPLGGSHL